MKFTFKRERDHWHPDTHYIKLRRVVVGTIHDIGPYKIRLMVKKKDINEDGNPNCEWKWIALKRESETLQEAKDFLNNNIDAIMEKFPIYIDDDK